MSSAYSRLHVGLVLLSSLMVGAGDDSRMEATPTTLPDVASMAGAKRDVWGDAAIHQGAEPSYVFFRDLLPPLRYVNTAFRHYPVVLSAPAESVKARWISNGSAVNARADKKPMWKEAGFPVHFLVGAPAEPFGAEVSRLDGPAYEAGHLPIVRVGYTSRTGTVYEEEAFVPVRGSIAAHGGVLVRFTSQAAGSITARIEPGVPMTALDRSINNALGQSLVLLGPEWRWDDGNIQMQAHVGPGKAAYLAILTRPMAAPLPIVDETYYRDERQACVERWNDLLGRGIRLNVPEPLVQDAWRSLVVGNFLIADGDRMNYSAGNAYDHLYEAECGDAVRSLLLYGFQAEARAMLGPLMAFNRKETRYHVAGHKLQLLAHYYMVTRDAGWFRDNAPIWGEVIDFVVRSRRPESGLLPPDRYAGDISQQVHSLNSNAACWRGLRDMSAVVDALGEGEWAKDLSRMAREYREAILRAVDQSEQRNVEPPFIPNALFGAEKAHDPLTATRMGSYYDLMAPYIIGSGVFAPGSEREAWMIRYLREHGGVALGMIRSTPHQGEFDNEPGVNVLYGLRYVLALLRRDERGPALVGFYGQLAQGMTRGTFIGGEGSRFLHGDRWGRSFYLPPNSASNATFLTILRYLLVQDWDLDDDGRSGDAPAPLRRSGAGSSRARTLRSRVHRRRSVRSRFGLSRG